jgi:predicted transcriptional regulator
MLKATGIGLPPDLVQRAKITAMERSTSLQQMVADALQAHLGKETNRQ